MVTGEGLGIFAPFMKADRNGRLAYDEMVRSEEFLHPITYRDIRPDAVDALILPGGHAPGMRPYLESAQLQAVVAELFERSRPVGAICHGVLIAARACRTDGKSVLYGRKTTALPKTMELVGWLLTCVYLGRYFRTYPLTVEDEVRTALAASTDFIRGPMMIRRDSPAHLQIGQCVTEITCRHAGRATRTVLRMISRPCCNERDRAIRTLLPRFQLVGARLHRSCWRVIASACRSSSPSGSPQ